MKITKSRIYTDVNLGLNCHSTDYTNYCIEKGKINDYCITKKLGKGKYSEVFKGRELDGNKVVIKVLKPVKLVRIQREVVVLKKLNHNNIIKLNDVVYDPASCHHSLIFNYIKNKDFFSCAKYKNFQDFKLYFKQLLLGVEYAHSNGIMHRDLKPMNLIVDENNKQIKIIDWGLAEFYYPETSYSVRISSRHYKAPELWIGYPYYDYSIDIWSLGCIFAECLFKTTPFFYSSKLDQQIQVIVDLLGTDDLVSYLTKYDITDLDMEQFEDMPRNRTDIHKFLKDSEVYEEIEEAINFLNKILIYDHQERLTAKECLEHPFFAT